MKTKINIFFFFTFAFFSSCVKDKPCVHSTTTKNIDIDDLTRVTYKDSTKLTFIRTSTNDTFVFKGTGWVTSYWSEQTQSDCYGTYYLQQKSIIFNCSLYAKPLIVSFKFFDTQTSDYLEIDFTPTLSKSPNTYIVLPLDINSFPNYDSLIIQHNTYYHIRYFKNDYNPQSWDKYGCYFNATNGILRMETSDGDMWELIKME